MNAEESNVECTTIARVYLECVLVALELPDGLLGALVLLVHVVEGPLRRPQVFVHLYVVNISEVWMKRQHFHLYRYVTVNLYKIFVAIIS